MSRRTDRVSNLLRRELSTLIQRELNDPRLGGLVSVTTVETTPDLLTARVFISALGGKEERESAVRALGKAEGFLRRALRDRLEMRPIPALLFEADASIEEGVNVSTLIDHVAAERSTGPETEKR